MCVFLGALTIGCVVVYVPTPYHKEYSRKNVSRKDAKLIKPGSTMKEDVILKLGEPDEVLENGSRWIYQWSKVHGQLAGFLLLGSGAGSIDQYMSQYDLVITFDSSGFVAKGRAIFFL